MVFSDSDLEEQLKSVVLKGYLLYKEHGSRSNKKLLPIHEWFARSVSTRIGKQYKVNSMGFGTTMEDKVKGLAYEKTIDIAIWKESKIIAGIAIKFVTSNYKQNTNNYFENMIVGGSNILYFQ